MARYVAERALTFRRTVEGREEAFQFNPGSIQEVPDWVADDDVFKLAVEEGSMHDTALDPSIPVINNPDYDPNRDPSVPDVYRKGEYPSRYKQVGKTVPGKTAVTAPASAVITEPQPLVDPTPPAVKDSLKKL